MADLVTEAAREHARAWMHAYGIMTGRYEAAGGDHPMMDTLPAAFEAYAAARPTAPAEDVVALRAEVERLRGLLNVPSDLLELLKWASQGRAYVSGSPWFTTGTLVLVGSPDPHAGTIIADTDSMDMRDDQRDAGREVADGEVDAQVMAEAWNRLRRQAAALSPTPAGSPASEATQHEGGRDRG